MMDEEIKRKYPIGTKIRFIASKKSCPSVQQDDGKVGEVVEYMMGLIGVYLPNSNNNHYPQLKETTWLTKARNLRILPRKNEQLLFAFMEQIN